MTQSPDSPYKDFETFGELFSQAEERLDYFVEGAKNEFTEKIVARMRDLGISKSELAERLDAERSFVTRLLSGNNNFTIETMVRIARALDCGFRSHLEPDECDTVWVDIMRSSMPNDAPGPKPSDSGTFEEIRHIKPTKPSADYATVPAVA